MKKVASKIKSEFWNLVIIFELILVAKIIIALGLDGTFIYPDEVCIIRKAIYFSQNLNLDFSCTEIIKFPVGEPMPFYSLLLAPIYKFINNGQTAFYAALSLNSLLVSSLLFPLYWMAKKITGKVKISYLIAALIVFLPSVVVYEKTMMTETFYLFTFIWTIFFYAKSLEPKTKKSNKLKLAAVIFSLIGTMTRPFGFILPMSIIANEVFIAKRKKLFIALFILSIGATAILLEVFIVEGAVSTLISKRIANLGNPDFPLMIYTAATQQLNSLTIGTFFILTIVFIQYLTNKKNPLHKIKAFLIIYVLLNLAVSANHMLGYFIHGNENPVLIMRYIQTSIVAISFIGLAQLWTNKKFQKTSTQFTIITSIIILVLMTFRDVPVKFSFNLEFTKYYDDKIAASKDLIASKEILKYGLLPFALITYFLFIKGKNKAITIIIGIVFCIQSALTLEYLANQQIKPQFVQIFSEKDKTNISIVMELNYDKYKGIIMKLFAETQHDLGIFASYSDVSVSLDHNDFDESKFFAKSKYIISPYNFNLQESFIIKIPTENILLYVYERPENS